jgi:hypothetical protein
VVPMGRIERQRRGPEFAVGAVRLTGSPLRAEDTSLIFVRARTRLPVLNGMGLPRLLHIPRSGTGRRGVDTHRMDQTRLARRRDLRIALAELRALDAESRAAPRGSKQRIALEAPIETSQRKVRRLASEP